MFTKETNLMKICQSLSNIVCARKFAQIKNQGERQPSSLLFRCQRLDTQLL